MSQVDVAIPAGVNYTAFDGLRLGRTSQVIVGRLLHFWDSRNLKGDGQFMGIVLLLDEKNSVIHGFIPAVRSVRYRPLLRAGSILKLAGFEVGRCTNLYKITDHPFVIRFIPTTTIVEVVSSALQIKHDKFMLRQLDHLQALANTNLELPDVVGQIRSVAGAKLNDQTSTQQLIVRLRLDTSAVAYLTLWGEPAATFRAHLHSGDTHNSVMIVTSVNPQLFAGNLRLNSTSATRFYFDKTNHVIQQFTNCLGIAGTEPFPVAETMGDILYKDVISIDELHTSRSKFNNQGADFLCRASIIGILPDNGWFYVACPGCSRKLDRPGTGLRCNKCTSPNVSGVARYCVELAVHDGHSDATFVVMDTQMTKTANKTAATLILEEGHGEGERALPMCLRQLAGKHFLFHIRLTPFNFTPIHQSFPVLNMTEISSSEDFSKDGSSKEAHVIGTKEGNDTQPETGERQRTRE